MRPRKKPTPILLTSFRDTKVEKDQVFLFFFLLLLFFLLLPPFPPSLTHPAYPQLALNYCSSLLSAGIIGLLLPSQV